MAGQVFLIVFWNRNNASQELIDLTKTTECAIQIAHCFAWTSYVFTILEYDLSTEDLN
eukprot:m.524489 g.524489  ORF g.524489 m.524489 type:complete len:58 (-) comp21988_c0_seq8:2547-2720(-)